MVQLKIEFFETNDGKEPAKEFLLSLNVKMRVKMMRTIALLSVNGNKLREPYSKHLGNGIFELRAQIGTDISRVLYFFVVDQTVILSHGFIKKTQKTPVREIERAERNRAEYMRRGDLYGKGYQL